MLPPWEACFSFSRRGCFCVTLLVWIPGTAEQCHLHLLQPEGTALTSDFRQNYFASRYPPPEKKEQGKDSSRSQMCRRLWVEIDLCKQESIGNHLTLSKHFRKTGNCSLVPDWWQFLLAITTSGTPGAGRCCAGDHGSPVLASVCDANRDGRACGNMWKWWVWGSEADGWKWNCFGGQICIFDF